MHSFDLETCGIKYCYFWFHSEVKFFMHFGIIFYLIILPYFNEMSIDFYAVKFCKNDDTPVPDTRHQGLWL